MLQDIKNSTISSLLQDLTAGCDTDYSLWKITKGLRRPKIQITLSNTGWTRSDLEKGEVFENHLESIFKPFSKQTANEDTTLNDSGDIELVTPNELKEEIKRLKAKKAPGYDLITSEVLKELPYKL